MSDVSKLFKGADSNLPGRHLSNRVNPERLTAIKEDFKSMARLCLEGSPRPPFARMADFVLHEHKVEIAPGTAQRLFENAMRELNEQE